MCAPFKFAVSPRDLSLLCTWRKEEDGTIFYTGKSVVDPKMKEVRGVVRGDNDLALWVMKPFNDGGQVSTKLTCNRSSLLFFSLSGFGVLNNPLVPQALQ